MTNVFPPSFLVPARMFQGTIGVESDEDEVSESSPRKSLKSILDRVSERMEESTARSEPDAVDVPQSEAGEGADLDMLLWDVQREDVHLSRALYIVVTIFRVLIRRTTYPQTSSGLLGQSQSHSCQMSHA